LRTFFLPECHAIQLDAHTLRAFRGDWIIKTNTLNEPAITAIARIRYNHIEEWAILGAAACKSDNYHSQTYFSLSFYQQNLLWWTPNTQELELPKGREFYDTL
jgi:hypothetical protein